jgi:ABC-type transporter Mla maintaining outer membrane lipid asymmetry ATPase subunit MlaF
VTHELASIFAIGNNSIFLDAESRTMIAKGDPKELLAHCTDHRVRAFLTRGEEDGQKAGGEKADLEKSDAKKSDVKKSEGSHG